MLVHRRVTPQQYVAGTHLYTWVKRDKVELSSCLRKKRDGRGLNPGPPDPEFEVLTARPHTPPTPLLWQHKKIAPFAAKKYLCSLELALTYEIFFQHSKRNFVSPCGQAVSSIYELSL